MKTAHSSIPSSPIPSSPTSSAVPSLQSRVVSRSPVYYGWVILFAGTFGMIMTTPGQTVGVSVFLDKIIADLGLSRSAVSLLYTLGTLVGSFSLPFIGRFIDRRGPRVAVVVIAALFALACVWMGLVGSLVGLLLGFMLIRGLGQGALGLVSIHVINIWFVRRRGLSVGLAGVGVALAMAFFPSLIEGLIGTFGWRGAYMLLGALVAVTILPVGALLFRGHPERYGLEPDGKVKQGAPAEAVFTAAEARRTVTFWLFALGGFSVAALSTGLIFHHYSIMAAGGLDRVAAATVFIPLGFMAAGANLTTGFLMDRLPPRFLLSVSLAFLCAALALATHVSSPLIILAYGSLLGLMQGMSNAIQASVYAHYFGRKHIGSIKGFTSTVGVAGASVGPLLFALGESAFGGYGLVLLLSALLPLALALAAPFTRPPQGALR